MTATPAGMYLPVVKPLPTDPPLTFVRRWLMREALHLPVKLRMALNQEYPWLAADSVRWLEKHLTPNMRVFEWGAGRSTLFFARRCAHVTSVEHKAKWRRKVQARLDELGIANAELLFHPPEASQEASGDYKPGFGPYTRAILPYPDRHFDIVLIDGRSRVACARHCVAKLKPGGVLILDNSERAKYHPIYQALTGWPARVFANGVWRTTVFIKPD